MWHDTSLEAQIDLAACRYGASQLFFRGPARPLDGRHIAFVGGGATRSGLLGAVAERLEAETGVPCVNFGVLNASVEAFLRDPEVPAACQAAQLTVLEMMGAANLSNRFYTVHPRRNDRFLRAAPALRVLFPRVDFAEVCFTQHLLLRLREADAERFELVREELRLAWTARMRSFLELAGPRVLLLWPVGGTAGPLGPEPHFVTTAMVEPLRPMLAGVAAMPAAETAAAARPSAAAALLDLIRAALDEGVRASA